MCHADDEHKEPSKLFPLPLSDFEYYMLTDDGPEFPMVFTLVIHLCGQLQRTKFEDAVNAALCVHPLLNSQVERVRRRGLCWVPYRGTESPIQEIEGNSGPQNSDRSISYIDLRHERGLRIFLKLNVASPEVMFHFHHASCDGAGAIEFVGEVFARYGRSTRLAGQDVPEVGKSELGQLAKRAKYCETTDGHHSERSSWRKQLGHAIRVFTRRPAVVRARRPVPEIKKADRHSHITTRVMPKDISQKLRQAAQKLGVSVNDLCIAQMLQLIREWNREANDQSKTPWIRLVIPVSLRTPEHDRMPAANLVSYVFVTRTREQCDESAPLLDFVKTKMTELLQRPEARIFLSGLRILRHLPGLLPILLRRTSCFGSTVLAYVGDVRRLFSGYFPQNHGKWVAGDVTIERIDGVAPIRPNTRVAVSIGSYAGEMILNLRSDSAMISTDDASEFLARYVSRLERIALTGSLGVTSIESSQGHQVKESADDVRHDVRRA